ncbi:MAG: hypothetical protein AAFQ82_14595, partial [Myxococcota bacterium]
MKFQSIVFIAVLTTLSLASCSKSTPRVVSVSPQESDQAFRATPPVPRPTRTFAAPVPERESLSNGLAVLTVVDRRLPMVTLKLVIATGHSQDSESPTEVTRWFAETLLAGMRQRD